MRQLLCTTSIAAVAFVLGILAARAPLPAHAAPAPLKPEVLDLVALAPSSIPPSTVFPTLRQKTLVVTDGMTAALSMGTAPKHYHADTNEIQLIVDGTGTEWLGDTQINLKPGVFVVIPAGTTHAGIVDTSGGRLRLVAFKTPPQMAGDYHPVH